MEIINKFTKKVAAEIGITALGIVCVGTFGVTALQNKAPAADKIEKIAKNPTISASTIKAENAEAKAGKTTMATEIVSLPQFRKASIDQYDATLVVKEKAKSDDKAKAAAKAEAEKKEEAAEAPVTTENSNPASFNVAFPNGEPEHYDIKNNPLNFTSTRDTSREYYTVHDIISGKTVTMNAHDMVCSMVCSEIGDKWDDNAIKAQAVAAYSNLRFNDSINSVPTVGLKTNYTDKIESCVKAVEGQVVLYDNSIINAVYFASAAGFTNTSKDIWNMDYPYLQCVKSEFDNEDPNWGIQKSYTKEDVKAAIEEKYSITLSDNVANWIYIDSTHGGKYITDVTIDSQITISGSALRNLFSIKSTAMDISFADGVFTFTSYGWGHGVGMSQWGAKLYADHGYTYDQILTHYYVNTTLGLSDENSKAVERGSKPQQTEQETSTTTSDSDEEENTSAAAGFDSSSSEA